MMFLTKWLPITLISEEFLISSMRFYVINNSSPCKNTIFFASYTKEVLWPTKKYLSCLLPLASVASLHRALSVIVWMYLFMLSTVPSFTKVRATWMGARVQRFPWHLFPPRKKPQRFYSPRLSSFLLIILYHKLHVDIYGQRRTFAAHFIIFAV